MPASPPPSTQPAGNTSTSPGCPGHHTDRICAAATYSEPDPGAARNGGTRATGNATYTGTGTVPAGRALYEYTGDPGVGNAHSRRDESGSFGEETARDWECLRAGAMLQRSRCQPAIPG